MSTLSDRKDLSMRKGQSVFLFDSTEELGVVSAVLKRAVTYRAMLDLQ